LTVGDAIAVVVMETVGEMDADGETDAVGVLLACPREKAYAAPLATSDSTRRPPKPDTKTLRPSADSFAQ